MNFIVQMNIFLFVKINILLCLKWRAVMHYFNAFHYFIYEAVGDKARRDVSGAAAQVCIQKTN